MILCSGTISDEAHEVLESLQVPRELVEPLSMWTSAKMGTPKKQACIYIYVHTYTHMNKHIYIYINIHACMHTYIHAYMHTCIHAYMPTCLHAYMPTLHYITL